jgi:hypothetical protein
MLQLSYLYSHILQHPIVLFLYSLAHFNLLLNYLKSKTKDQSSQYNLENPEEILSSRYNYLFIMKNIERLLTTIAQMNLSTRQTRNSGS